jgi:hypothetical protein
LPIQASILSHTASSTDRFSEPNRQKSENPAGDYRENDGGNDCGALQMGGAYRSTIYVLSPDWTEIQKLSDGTDFDFADLDNDGIYEFIAWNRRPDGVHCDPGIFYTRFYPEVFVRVDGWRFRKAWPPADWSTPRDQVNSAGQQRKLEPGSGPKIQVVGGFADLNHDGRVELICLEDRFQVTPKQSLTIYGFSEGSFHLVTRADVPAGQTAYLLSGVERTARGPEITVFAASPEQCKSGGWDPTGKGTLRIAYVYQDGRLER